MFALTVMTKDLTRMKTHQPSGASSQGPGKWQQYQLSDFRISQTLTIM